MDSQGLSLSLLITCIGFDPGLWPGMPFFLFGELFFSAALSLSPVWV
jgi:hypothetical protein